MNKRVLDHINRLRAITDTGLLYAGNEYDKERYAELLDISFMLMSDISGHTVENLRASFPLVADYPTAKVDIRGIVLGADNKILMVKECMDRKWSIPGGWADIGNSRKETIIKEMKEETGLDVMPQKLLAVFDKRKHAHPPDPLYSYKMVFYCQANAGVIRKGFDVLDVEYFDIHNLPELSEPRILKSQLEFLYKKMQDADFDTYFD
jgi:ADP-ribose pyrophosphatase YjhB (NUDIX family)